MSFRRLFLTVFLLVFSAPVVLRAQGGKDVDSLVSLLSAKSMELIEKHGVDYRKVTGPARFLHNNTYLVCDTALWNVNAEQIEAMGNVKIIQDGTVLSGDRLLYLIKDDLAQFRGGVVQLQDKDGNMLRTKYLDYNTKDSVAYFRNGGAMKEKTGQIIESLNGQYDSKVETFTFSTNVNMFTDSIFVKTTRLEYKSPQGLAVFGRGTDAWRDDNMLSSDAGWYDRGRELFLFYSNVHGMTGDDREGWADSLYYNRNTGDVEMLGHAQVTDGSRRTSALAGRIFYRDSLSEITMSRTPAIVGVTDTTGTAKDTVYVGADLFVLRSVPKYAVDSLEFTLAQSRLSDISADAVGAYRKSAKEAAEKAAAEARNQNVDYVAEQQAKARREALAAKEKAASDSLSTASGAVAAAADSLSSASAAIIDAADSLSSVSGMPAVADTLAASSGVLASASDSLAVSGGLSAQADSLSAAAGVPGAASDSLAASGALSVPADTVAAAPADSTKVGFVDGRGRVRLYRTDFQMLTDSLKFNELDSLLRLYKNPVVWNEGNRQYAADSIYVSFGEKNLDKAYLMSDAFITVEEAPGCHDQIRSTEMLAYFGEDGGLSRFDATGGVDAIFYIKEDSTYATVNKSQAKLLSANLKEGNLDDIFYFDQAKNDVYPLAQLKSADRQLKGFNWQPELRPSSPSDIITFEPRVSQREDYASRPKAEFKQTEIYYPGYIGGIYKEIDERKAHADSLAALKAVEEPAADSLSAAQDGISASIDTVSAGASSIDMEKVADKADSSAVSAAVLPDSLASAGAGQEVLSKAALRKAARDAKWARLDSLDAAKAAVKAEKKAAKLRAKKLAELMRQEKQDRKDAARLEKYRLRYEKKYARGTESASVEKKEEPVSEALPDSVTL